MRRLNRNSIIALLSLLLAIALGLLIFMAIRTVEQVRSFQQHNHAVKVGDVSTVRPWMTIHTVSHIYHVPEIYLFQELQIRDSESDVTLNVIAKTTHQPVNSVVQHVQHAILAYRKTHPPTALLPQPAGSDVPQSGRRGA